MALFVAATFRSNQGGWLGWLLGLGMVWFLTWPAAAQTSGTALPEPVDISEVSSPSFRIFSDKDGLPQNTLQTMTLDRQGYLWVGTLDGAACYNGRSWTKVAMPAEAASNIVNFITLLSDGSLWFGTDGGGLHRFNRETGEWKTFDPGGRQYGTFVLVIELAGPTSPPQVLCTTRRGQVLRGPPDQLQPFAVPLSGDDFVTAACETTAQTGARTLWLGTRKGRLFRFRDSAWNIFSVQPRKPDPEGVQFLIPQLGATDESLWVGAYHGLWTFAGESVQKTDCPPVLEKAAVICFLETTAPQGDPIRWVGSDSGLFRWQQGKWRHFTVKAGLPHNFIYHLLETGPGNAGGRTLWIGTLGGLARLETGKWWTVNTAAGINNHFILSLGETANAAGRPVYWIGTYGGDTGGVWKFEDGNWTNFDTHNGLPNNVVWAICETRSADGTPSMWFGSNGGLSELRNGGWRRYSQKEGLPFNSVSSLAETRSPTGDSILWGATFGGLIKLENGHITVFKTQDGLVSNSTQTVLATKNAGGGDIIWVGTIGGLSRFENGRWTNYTTESGLVHNQVLSMREITTPDGHTFLWVGTRGGASRLDLKSGRWRNFTETTEPALPNNTVYQIREDAAHRLYLSTNKGIIRLTPKDAQADSFEVFRFGLEDGLPSNECNRGASLVDRQGRLWFGTIAGVAIYDPRDEIRDQQAKPLYIERVAVRGQPATLLPNSILAYNRNNLSFEYALLSFFRETETEYQTQLIGLEAAPTGWQGDSKKEYLNLGEGRYVFRVWARDYAGNLAGPVDFGFTVQPAPWRTWWAYGVYTLLLVAAGYGYAQYRLQRLKIHNAELEAKVADRTAQVVAQKDELEQVNLKLRELDQLKANFTAMLVHDLKSPLSVVKASLELFEDDEVIRHSDLSPLISAANRSVDKILNLIGEVLEVFRSESQEIRLKSRMLDIRTLLLECAAESRVAASRQQIAVVTELTSELPMVNGDAEKLERAISNLLSNAIKFTPAGGTITIETQTIEGSGVERGLNWLRITITDTGEGIPAEELPYLFDPYRQAASNKAKMGVGLGLAIVKRIVAAHGGNVSVRSQVGVGTSFTIVLPLVTSSDQIERLEMKV